MLCQLSRSSPLIFFQLLRLVNANFLMYEYLHNYGNSTEANREWTVVRNLVKNMGAHLNCEDPDPKRSLCDVCIPAISEFWRHFSYLYKDAHFLAENATYFRANLTFPGTGYGNMEIDAVRCDFLTTRGGNWNPNFVYITKGRVEQWTYFILNEKDNEYVVDHLHVKWLVGVLNI